MSVAEFSLHLFYVSDTCNGIKHLKVVSYTFAQTKTLKNQDNRKFHNEFCKLFSTQALFRISTYAKILMEHMFDMKDTNLNLKT